MNVSVKTMPELRVAYVRRKGAYGPEIGQCFEKLMAWAAPKGLCNEKSLVIGAYWDCPEETAPEECRSDACITVSDDVQADPENGIEIQTLPGGLSAMYLCNIFDNDFCTPWTEMMKEWMPNSNYTQTEGPCLELYYNCGISHPLQKWVVDICVPVKEK